MHQGWPKFAASLWMVDGEGGLAAVAYAPCEVHGIVARKTPALIEEETEYPFGEEVVLRVNPESPAEFPVRLRIPGWARGAQVRVNNKMIEPCEPGTFVNIERRWKQGDLVEMRFPMRPRITRWYQDSIVVERGPLIFSLDLRGEWRKLRTRGMTADWEVYPRSEWNYALDADEQTAESALQIRREKLGENPFVPDQVPVRIVAKGSRVADWKMEDNVAAPPPPSPATTNQPEETLTLVPYAAAKLRITAFPELKRA